MEEVPDSNAIDSVSADDGPGTVDRVWCEMYGESSSSHQAVFWIHSVDVWTLYVVLQKDV